MAVADKVDQLIQDKYAGLFLSFDLRCPSTKVNGIIRLVKPCSRLL